MLLSEPDWILRRVETIQLAENRQLERRVTTDVAISTVFETYEEVVSIRPDTVPVPLLTLLKGLHLDVDLKSSEGASVPVAPSSIDSVASVALMARWISSETGYVDHPAIPELLTFFYEVARASPPPLPPRHPAENVPLEPHPVGPESLLAQGLLRVLRKKHEFQDRFSILQQTYFLMAEIREDWDDTTLLKTRIVESRPNPVLGLFSALLLAPSQYLFLDVAMQTAPRSHLRFDAPLGTEICGMTVEDIFARDEEQDLLQKRVTPTRAVLYGKKLNSPFRLVTLRLTPLSGRFRLASFLISLLGASVLAGGYWLETHKAST